MRMLSGEEAPDSGQRLEGHNVVVQYFAQDEAARMDPNPTVYEALASGSPTNMVPAIRNILGGFLFSGDDVYKRVRVLSGGERTRLAVARMLLRPSNTLLLDEPTNHLDLDSKEVLLDAQIAEAEQTLRDIEQAMAAPGFYADRTAAQPLIDRHQSLMWQVGDLMHQWEELQTASDLTTASDT